MKRRNFLVGAGAVGAASLLPRPAIIAALASEKTKVTLGYQSLWAGGGQVFEALRHTNILELHGVEAEFKTFTFGIPLGEAAVAGGIDNVYAADAPTLRAISRIPGSKIFHRTHDQRYAVVVRSDFKGTGLADLRGHKLSGAFGTTVFPRSVRAIIEAGVKEPFKEIQIINQDVAEQAELLKSGLVDGVVTWDPTYERLLQEKTGKELWKSRAYGVQAFTGPWLEKNGEEGTVKLIKAWVAAVQWTSNNIEKADEWFAQTSRLDTSLLKVANEADRYLKAPVADIKTLDFQIGEAEIADTQKVIDFLIEQKLLTTKIDAASFYDNKPLLRAQKEIAAGNSPDLSKISVLA